MELTKVTMTDRIEYLPESKVIQVREATRIMEGKTVISTTYHRYVVDATTDKKAVTDANVLKAMSLYFQA